MKYTKRINTLVLFLQLLNAASGQTAAFAAIQKIYTAYNTGNSISFSSQMKMYVKNNPGKIIERMQGSYTVKEMNFYCSIGPVVMLMNDTYYVSADKTLKQLMIGYRKDLPATGQSPVLYIGQFKKWIMDKAIEAALLPQGSTAVLELTDEKGITGYNRYSIAYWTATGYMKKVILEMSDYNDAGHATMVLEVNYTPPSPAASNKNMFSEKSFFSIANKKIRLADNYKNYQLINQL